MPPTPFLLYSFPRAIVHLDGDAFFASVEQSVHPELKGRPVVTGKERGIIACASYEAKALGIQRGLALWEAERRCRDLVVLPSDYETYSLFSKRMFSIMRRFTPDVEEYSIDEGFADLTGMRRVFRCGYEEIARRMQAEIQGELDIGVSVGLSVSKSLAKLGSKYRKPNGFTAVRGRQIHQFLPCIPLEKVWGFGPNTVNLLRKCGLQTAFDFVSRPEDWARKLLGKPGVEIWNELRGASVFPLVTEEKHDYATISKCKTFTVPSADRDFVYAMLVRNVESACIKLRRHRLRARTLVVMVRRRDFSQDGLEAALSRPTASAQEALPLVRELFDRLFREGQEYRATSVMLGKLEADGCEQLELFEDRVLIDKLACASKAVDAINDRFGKHKVGLGTSLFLPCHRQTARDETPARKTALLPGETRRCRLALPRLFVRV